MAASEGMGQGNTSRYKIGMRWVRVSEDSVMVVSQSGDGIRRSILGHLDVFMQGSHTIVRMELPRSVRTHGNLAIANHACQPKNQKERKVCHHLPFVPTLKIDNIIQRYNFCLH